MMERQSNLKREMEKLTNLLDDLSKGYNPNYQDMAVKGAVMAYRSWKRSGEENDEGVDDESKEEEGALDEEEAVKLKELFEEGDWTSDKLREMTDNDPLSLMDDAEFQRASTPHESGICELPARGLRKHRGYLTDTRILHFNSVPHPRVPARRSRSVL